MLADIIKTFTSYCFTKATRRENFFKSIGSIKNNWLPKADKEKDREAMP